MIANIKHRLLFNYNFSKTLGVGFLGKIKLFIFLISVPIVRFINKTNKLNAVLNMQKFNKVFQFTISSSSDIAILYAIFVEDEYQLVMKTEPETILDLGSNVGGSLIYFALKYPDAKIYGYEPDPETFTTLKSNVADYSNIFVEQAAITNKSGKTKFYANSDSSMSSSLIKRSANDNCVEVNAKTLDQIIDEQKLTNINLLKFDVEGAECDVFEVFTNSSIVKNIIGELHIDLIDVSKERFYSYFPEHDFIDSKLHLPNMPDAERYIICAGECVGTGRN